MLSNNANIVCTFIFGGTPPPPALQGLKDRIGFADSPIDYKIDGVVRRGFLYLDDETTWYQSFALSVAALYLAPRGIVPAADPANSNCVQLGRATFCPLESNYGPYRGMNASGFQFLIDFKGPRRFREFTLGQALRDEFSSEDLSNKIVLIGATAESVHDYNATPLDEQHHGLYQQALLVNQLLRAALDGDQPLRVWPPSVECAWILLWCLAGAGIGLWARSIWLSITLIVGGLVGIASIAWAAFASGWWLIVAAPAGAFLLSSFMVFAYSSVYEWLQRRIVMRLFSQNVSPEVAKEIWDQREAFLDGNRPRSQQVKATVLFTDLKGFTTLAEKLEPDQVLEWLNGYMAAMSKVVMEHRGVVEKYIGDSIMAVFGVPVPRNVAQQVQQDAIHAVSAALAMRDRIMQLNDDWKEEEKPTAMMRVGVHSGLLVAGCLGGADRMEYTVIGDTVNIASRLESYKEDPADPGLSVGGCRILISDGTWQLVNERFQTEIVGEILLKGKEKPVKIYSVLAQSTVPEAAAR